ncbi:MAG: hypothetical protein M1826_004574 [Phylliscum demangeonii]|nr:MAG: hypothetical protein M1826_004574 [Phylliscum demangeonii]
MDRLPPSMDSLEEEPEEPEEPAVAGAHGIARDVQIVSVPSPVVDLRARPIRRPQDDREDPATRPKGRTSQLSRGMKRDRARQKHPEPVSLRPRLTGNPFTKVRLHTTAGLRRRA